MPRPCKCRWVDELPAARHYRPEGGGPDSDQPVVLGLDELESLRLADHEGLYHNDAAECMNVSRPTFGRILQRARGKVVDAILHGKRLVVGGGPVCAYSPGGADDGVPGQCTFGRRSCRRFQRAHEQRAERVARTSGDALE